jgi:hypothetical protein
VYIGVREFIDEYLPQRQGQQIENQINPNPMPASPNSDHIIENWQGINFKNANPTISGNNFNFGTK